MKILFTYLSYHLTISLLIINKNEEILKMFRNKFIKLLVLAQSTLYQTLQPFKLAHSTI